MAPLIPLLLKAATLVPALTNFLGTGEASQKIAEKVADVVKVITGEELPEVALNKIAVDPALLHKFQLAVNAQYMDWDAMFLADVKDARARDAKMTEAGYRNWRAHIMFALAVTVVVLLTYLIWDSAVISEYTKGIFTLVLGRFLGYLDNIYNFEFGMTRQSVTKDETIQRLSKNGYK
jgi:hypothetical protein